MKYNFINDDIKIDFPTSAVMENSMKEAEELDLQNSMGYYGVAESIDVLAKNLNACGKITEEQWALINARYPLE